VGRAAEARHTLNLRRSSKNEEKGRKKDEKKGRKKKKKEYDVSNRFDRSGALDAPAQVGRALFFNRATADYRDSISSGRRWLLNCSG